MDLKQTFLTAAPNIKAMINIGCLLDIPTSTSYYTGRYGESILNGGLGFLTGVAGPGNSFKSTLTHYMNLVAMSRMAGSTGNTYDTEINIHENHLKDFAARIEEFKGEDPIDSERWVITDKTVYHGDQWYDLIKDFMQEKRKHAKSIMVTTPFMNRDKTEQLQIIQPTFSSVDSLSEFVTQDVIKMQDDNQLGESGANTVFMRQGLQKNRFLQEIVGLAGGSYNYVLMVAQIGDKFELDMRNPKQSELAHLKGNIELKGVPNKFTFTMNNCWHCYGTTVLINQSTKAPEYPRHSDDDMTGDTDLSILRVRQLRSKSGPSGITIEIIVSQQEGILPSLTEFHYLKEHERFGFEGSVQNYTIVLCPDIKLSRTSVRGKIDRHPELRRSLNILAEMKQMYDLWHFLENRYRITPKQLYDKLIELGYDWTVLLKTRGWWALEGTFTEIPFLSTMDLLKMYNNEYIPYWMESPPAKAIELYNQQHETPWKYDPSWKK